MCKFSKDSLKIKIFYKMRNIYICTNEFPTEDNFDGGVGNHFYRYAKILKKILLIQL